MSRYYQPGDPNYIKPNEDWAKNQSVDALIAGGYSLTPEQINSLSPGQSVDYLNRLQGTEGYDPRFPGMEAPMGAEANLIHESPHWLTNLGISALKAGVAAGFGANLGPIFNAATGAGGSVAGTSSVPGLTGLSGAEAGAFPLTTAGASGLEASVLPLTTAGAGSTAGGLGALGAGASMGDLSNIATQGVSPNIDYLNIENVNKLRKGLGDLAPNTSQQPTTNTNDPAVDAQPEVPYDITQPLYLGGEGLNINQDTGLRLAGGGFIGGGIIDLYTSPDGFAKGGYLDGPGDGMSDSIPATIEGSQPAALARSEYVLSADAVSHIGNGSSEAGAQRLDKMVDNIRKARTGTTQQGKQINPDNFLPA